MDKLKELIVEQALEISNLKAEVERIRGYWLAEKKNAENANKELFELKKNRT
jgi:hypothetical protein